MTNPWHASLLNMIPPMPPAPEARVQHHAQRWRGSVFCFVSTQFPGAKCRWTKKQWMMSKKKDLLGGGKYFWNFHPDFWGRWIQFDEYFSDGWFKHQLAIDITCRYIQGLFQVRWNHQTNNDEQQDRLFYLLKGWTFFLVSCVNLTGKIWKNPRFCFFQPRSFYKGS